MDELQCCLAHSYGWGMSLTADAPAEVISSSSSSARRQYLVTLSDTSAAGKTQDCEKKEHLGTATVPAGIRSQYCSK